MNDPSDDQPDNNSNEGRSYWSAGARTRRHWYFYPRDNIPGILLFGVIAVLGCVSLIVAARHFMVAGSIMYPDIVLTVIGLAALLLGLYQGWQLWRTNNQ